MLLDVIAKTITMVRARWKRYRCGGRHRRCYQQRDPK